MHLRWLLVSNHASSDGHCNKDHRGSSGPAIMAKIRVLQENSIPTRAVKYVPLSMTRLLGYVSSTIFWECFFICVTSWVWSMGHVVRTMGYVNSTWSFCIELGLAAAD